MKILLIEDDEKLCSEFEKIIKQRNNINLVVTTNSSREALKLVKTKTFDGIIVDLELHYGEGSGLNFLQELEKNDLPKKPIIIVNTNIISDVVYDNIHAGIADMIFYKKQKGYSPKVVVDSLELLRKNNNQSVREEIQLQENSEEKIRKMINLELDLIGINYKLKGREYLFEAIYYILSTKAIKEKNFSVFQYLGNKYKLLTSSISRAIQTAINETWRTSAIEDLRENYTAKINYHTGVPTPTEFIYYYVDKINKMI